jgi:UDP-N-acetyl-D-mannosaminuronic acid dehydrogenase
VTETVVKVSSLEAAELIKLLDNTYRDITISIGNLYGKICEKLNLDAKEVIEAANHGYSRNKILFPGAGVGGGCLVKDPYLLLYSLDEQINLDLIKASRKINDSMISDTITLIKSSFKKIGKKIANSKILVLGFAFKGTPLTDDMRFSPTLPIIDFLQNEGAKIYGYDIVVKSQDIQELGIENVSQIYEKNSYDCIILMNNNQEFRELDFKKLEGDNGSLLVIDGWYMYDSKELYELGIKYFALGAKNEIF